MSTERFLGGVTISLLSKKVYFFLKLAFKLSGRRSAAPQRTPKILGCVSLGESENGFVIPDHMDSSTPKKRKIRKRIILS